MKKKDDENHHRSILTFDNLVLNRYISNFITARRHKKNRFVQWMVETKDGKDVDTLIFHFYYTDDLNASSPCEIKYSNV